VNKPVKVLMVEDSEDDAKLALRALRHGGFDPTSRRVQTAADLETALTEERWDAVISDYNMPGFTGIDALTIFRSTGLDIPFILISGTIGEETAVNAMKAGASDYVMKKSLVRLGPALERELKETKTRAAHRRSQRDLIESEERFRSLTEISSDFYWESDTEHRLTARDSANKKMSSVSAFQRGAQIGERRWEIPHLSPDEAGWQAHRAVLDAHLPFRDFELSRLGADGAERHISISGDPVFDASGAFKGYRGVGTDVTARKRTAQELRESERRFNDMLDNVELISLMLDREARITYCNEYLLRLTGWRHEEVIGQNWVKLFVPREINYMKDVFPALLADSSDARHRESEILTRSGQRRVIRWNNSVLRSGAGDVIGTASIGEDITERKEAEARIAYLNRVFAMLSGINTLIVRARDRDELFKEACRVAVEQGGFRMSLISIVDRSAMKIVPVASAGKDEELLTAVKSILSSSEGAATTMVARAIREKKAVVSNDSQSDPGVLSGRKYAESGIRSMAMVPLIVADEAVGVLALYASEIDFFHEEELKLLTGLAGDISFGVENISRQQTLAKLARIRAVSGEINAAIIRIHDRDELFRETCRIAVEHGGFEIAWISLLDPATLEIAPTASAGVDSQIFLTLPPASAWPGTPQSRGELGRAIQEKRPVFSNDLVAEPGVGGARRHEAIRRGYRSVIAIPLLVDDAVVGILSLYAREPNFFNSDELKLLAELAGDISFALDHIDKQERLDYHAYYDALTGLANRSLFLERVAQYLRSAASGGHRLAVFLIDLERFKNINDSLGQPAGDALLKQVAEWLTRNAGDVNLLARVGADHFAAVLPAVKQEGDLARLLEKTMAAFLDHPFHLNEAVFRISAKVGVALFPDDGADADTLFKNAEAALKKAKAGGDRYLFYTQKMNEAVAGKLTLENQLRQALDNEEFVLHYQPKVSFASGKVSGAEALIRWNDPRTGLMGPGRFVPILEETGLIYDVGRWALKKAIADYLRWRAAGLPAVPIAVNVSPLQLRHRGFVGEIERAVGIDAQAAAGLELEITENLIMEDIKHNIASLQAIRATGVGIAVDDFGTGFSSLSYLAKLPVDTLKIDRSFVIEMTLAPEGLALVSTIISLAHSLKLKVVAEGVETEEQSRLLRILNCDEMQGFLFGKPVPAEVFETRFLAPPPAG
jgi:diguanylate cyclase (GGDEF)-like protein/PAS domain S-box-containing protein